MTVVAKRSVLELMDESMAKAEKASKGFVPTFLLLKDRQKAIIRPLFNLDVCVPFAIHNKYNQADPKQSVNAVCATELGKPCVHCASFAAGDKKLAPKI